MQMHKPDFSNSPVGCPGPSDAEAMGILDCSPHLAAQRGSEGQNQHSGWSSQYTLWAKPSEKDRDMIQKCGSYGLAAPNTSEITKS